jgi:alanine dehydrogenase
MRDRAPGNGRDLRVENQVGGLYSDDDQEAVSQNAIEALAREMSRPVEEVKDIYEGEFARLREGARIHDYLILFASRHTRDVLAHGRR